jgi:hypothetical protein
MSKSVIAGILGIISCAFGILGTVMMFAVIPLIESVPYGDFGYGYEYGDMMGMVTGLYYGIGIVLAIISAVAVVGTIFAFKKSIWGLALAGMIAGAILFFPTGVASVILIALGKGEFVKLSPADEYYTGLR